MSFEEEFDKIIRQKAEDAKFPFDESNWEKTSRLIDADRKVTQMLSFKKFLLPGVLVIVAGSLGLASYAYLKQDKSNQSTALIKNINVEESPVLQALSVTDLKEKR